MITFDHVSFSYPEVALPALHEVTLTLLESSFTLISGPSGAGKTTLLRCLNGLVPHFSGGVLTGRIRVSDLDPVALGPEVMCRHVGFVFQDPETQFVMDYVEDELAFALENAAMSRAEMRSRVGEVIELLDLGPLRHRSLATLSGGEKQRIAIAAALAFRPRVLVLDEPTSQLDPRSAREVLEALGRLNRDLGLTVILAEHRLERVLPFADRLVYLPAAEAPVVDGVPDEVLGQIDLVPPVTTLGKALGWSPLPVTVAEGRRFCEGISVQGAEGPQPLPESARAEIRRKALGPQRGSQSPAGAPRQGRGRSDEAGPTLVAEGLSVAYDGKPVLTDVSLSLYPGQVTALLGRNGAGKSTLLKALVGLVPHQDGSVWLSGRETSGMAVADVCREVAYLPQDPNALLFAETVLEELHITLRNHGVTVAEVEPAPEALLETLGLLHKVTAYPRDLSVGERQRAALAAILVTQPSTVLLDEPTRGLDYDAKDRLLALMHRWRVEQRAVLLVTHDVELVAEAADRVVILDGGGIAAEGSPAELLGAPVFGDSEAANPFMPQMARLFPGSGWLTVANVLSELRSSPVLSPPSPNPGGGES
ncbi:MAG: ATP-binding cassette domain-containing protein [Anaerolineae bacterium]|nr:ATP-binding cassette domain-containing protein [Anaerolineae bacterium]